jgi:Iap family predicted aminopeptidase
VSRLSELEGAVLQQVSSDRLWQHAKTIAQWERVSGTPGERAALEYCRRCLIEYGFRTNVYEFEALLGWPKEAQVELRFPVRQPVNAITHAFVPSSVPEGIEGDMVYVHAGEEADFARHDVAGRIAMVDGLASPMKVLRAQKHGVGALVFVAPARLHEMCVSPVWGTPTPKTAALLPNMPVVSVLPEAARAIEAHLSKGPVRLWMRTRTFWDWCSVPLLVGEVAGSADPDQFVLFSGHLCSWYYGAVDNGAANATMLEVARILAPRRGELRRSLRLAFWPGHSQGRFAGSTWYFDHFWEELHDCCVLHINVDSTGARGATIYQSLCMPETRDFALEVLHDAIGVKGQIARQPRAGDQSFWGCGIPSMWGDLSQVPSDLSADPKGSGLFSAGGPVSSAPRGGLPWWWHTAEDTLDKIDPAVHIRDTQAYLLACTRAATLPLLPFRYAAAATSLRQTLEQYRAGAGDGFELQPVIERAREMEEVTGELDDLLEQMRARPGVEQATVGINKKLREMDRRLVRLNFSAEDGFEPDVAVPVPPVPLLEPVSRLGGMDRSANDVRYLVAEMIRNRNRVMFQLREALGLAREVAAIIRKGLTL